MFWEKKNIYSAEESPSLRDKSISFGFGLEITPRPTTCLGISSGNPTVKFNNEFKTGLKGSLPEIVEQTDQKLKAGVSKVVRFDSNMKFEEQHIDSKYSCNVDNTVLETFEPIPYVDEDDANLMIRSVTKMVKDTGLTQAVNTVLVQKRGKLDKALSTPAYGENSDDDLDVPPAIEPRLNKTPPAPPPRPKKTTTKFNEEIKIKEELEIESPRYTKQIPPTKHFLEEQIEPLELLTPSKTKSLTLKKKNSILAKGRKISLKNLGTSDIQGHLYRRSKDKHGVAYWAKLYFVLIDNALYSFKLKDSQKADSLIFLSGFTVSPAPEVHSKNFAFKVYHSSKTFYFAAESNEAQTKWLEYLGQAILKVNTNSLTKSKDKNLKDVKELFTETESSDDDYDVNQSIDYSSSPITPKHEKYHLGFGSLKKFTKSSFSSNKNSDKRSDVPVPTAQYKSYRKVPGHAGIQVGTNSNVYISSNLSQILPPTPPTPVITVPEIFPQIQSFRKISLSSIYDFEKNETKFSYQQRSKKSRKTSPHNYIHASNPNLVEFDFQTSRTLDFSLPRVHPGNSWEAQHNFHGFVTLKDLMLQKKEEEEQEMYNNRVYLGVEKKDDRTRPKRIDGNKTNQDETTSSANKPVNKIQSRSLPKTPDYAQSFKPDDKAILMARTKEGQKLRDFGYEFISGDDKEAITKQQIENSVWLRRNDRVVPTATSSLKKKSMNWMTATGINDKKVEEVDKSSRQGSLKKPKNKIDLKASTEKLFQFKNNSNNEKDSLKLSVSKIEKTTFLKPSSSYLPMTLPLNKKSSNLFHLQRDHPNSGSIKKSNTVYGTNSERIVENPRKNSAPERSASYLTKLAFASGGKTAKEKKLLGSPRLHRAIFGRSSSHSENQFPLDSEIFSSFNKVCSDWFQSS